MIGGPAEGWRYNEKGIAVGRESGKAALFLDDLVTVLRTFAPHGPGYFNCQIVPREEGLRRIKQFVEESNARGPLDPGAVRNWTNQLQQQLGLQDVEINGIPDDSRVAEVIFEADYRLKMIGIGKLPGGAGIPSVFDLLPKTGEVKSRRMDALRWWLSMKYDAVMHSPDRNVFEIQGSAVLCQSENEKISATGQRIHTGKSEAANRLFAANFTGSLFRTGRSGSGLCRPAEHLRLVPGGGPAGRQPRSRPVGLEPGCVRCGRGLPHGPLPVAQDHHVGGQPPRVQRQGHRGAGGRRRRRPDSQSAEDPHVFRETTQLAGVQNKGRAPELPEGRWWWDAKSH